MDQSVILLAGLAGGYLLGSVPFGLVLTRLAGLGDVRKIGSGNIGATNVLRTGRKDIAAATLLLDAFKGTVAVLIAAWLLGPVAGLSAGFGAFIGHCFPVWLGFKGGKGVATFLGILLAVSPLAALIFAGVWLASAAITRYSSLSALLATAATPPALYMLGATPAEFAFAVMAAISWLKHKDNITRLLSGKESRIGRKG